MKPAIHLEANTIEVEHPSFKDLGRVQEDDLVLRYWKPARWAQRIKMNRRFHLKDGNIIVKSAGIYFIYAQV